MRDTRLENVIRWSRQLSEYLSPQDEKGLRILGPASAPLARLNKEHRFQFLLKSPKRTLLTKVLTGALAFCDARDIPPTRRARGYGPADAAVSAWAKLRLWVVAQFPVSRFSSG